MLRALSFPNQKPVPDRSGLLICSGLHLNMSIFAFIAARGKAHDVSLQVIEGGLIPDILPDPDRDSNKALKQIPVVHKTYCRRFVIPDAVLLAILILV